MKKFAFAAAPLFLALGATAAAAEPAWRLSEVSGEVRIVSNGVTRQAMRGALLASGSTIVAGQRSKAVLVRNKDVVVVSANSRVRIAPPEQQKGLFQMIAEYGTSLFTIEHKQKPHFGVQTPYLAAVVKGTVFSVTVTEAGASVQVTQGAVDVGTLDGGAHELIRPGMIGAVGAGDRYQLRVEGGESRILRSEGAPPAGTVSSTTAPVAAPSDGAAPGEAAVADAVSTSPVSLTDVTGGLVQGTAGIDLALATASNAEATRQDGNGGAPSSGGNAGGGNGNGGSGGSGSGGSGNGSGSAGSGDGNGGSSDNGGNGGSSAGGNGGSNAGGSNAGGNGSSDNGGNGGSNAGGNGGSNAGGNGGGSNAGGNGGGSNAGGNAGGSNGGGAGSPGGSGKPDEGKPGKPDDGKPGKPDEGKPDKPDDKPGKPDEGKPDKPDDGKPDKPDDAKPDKPGKDDSGDRPGDDHGRDDKPGKDDHGDDHGGSDKPGKGGKGD